MIRLVFITIILSLVFNTHAQRNVTDGVISTPYVGIHYGGNLTGGDYSDRFGYTNHLGAIVGWKSEMNWIFAIDGNFMFGNQVFEPNFLDNMKDSQGTITNSSGGPAIINPMQRGFNINGTFGFVFEGTGHNPNSGIMILLGAGYMWHKIRIETREDEVPQLNDDKLIGYDRLTTGLNTTQFIGYNFMANRGIANFYAGFYFIQGHTFNQRTLFWDRPQYEVPTDRRLDLQYGIRLGWMIPIYKRQPKDFYFN